MWALWVVLGCGSTPQPPAASATVEKAPEKPVVEAPPTDELLFVSERRGRQEAFRQVPRGAAAPLDLCPQLSFPGPVGPAGQGALLVCSDAEVDDRHGEQVVWTDLQGKSTPISSRAAQVRNPAWAPDGSFIVYESSEASFRDLFRADRSGKRSRLTDQKEGQFEPDISPDGKRLAFVSSRDGNAEVYVADIDGAHPTRLTSSPGDDGRPFWSPDGQRIAFLSAREGPMRVWTMKADGTDARALIPGGREDHLDLAWSPDGSKVAVVAQVGNGASTLMIVSATGETIGQISGGRNEHPCWHRAGAWLAYDTDHTGDVEVFVAKADGTSAQNVTNSPGPDWLPRWQRPATP